MRTGMFAAMVVVALAGCAREPDPLDDYPLVSLQLGRTILGMDCGQLALTSRVIDIVARFGEVARAMVAVSDMPGDVTALVDEIIGQTEAARGQTEGLVGFTQTIKFCETSET
ncbi:MAG: hypothetical protein AAFQ51_08700 [Pseudomonadota bacterium]